MEEDLDMVVLHRRGDLLHPVSMEDLLLLVDHHRHHLGIWVCDLLHHLQEDFQLRLREGFRVHLRETLPVHHLREAFHVRPHLEALPLHLPFPTVATIPHPAIISN